MNEETTLNGDQLAEAATDRSAEALCPGCGEILLTDAKFCEACGHDVNTELLPACVSCGERSVGEEGYCQLCGHKQPAERDHKEFETETVVAVTDRGRRHRHNEDAVAIGESEGATFLLVCDGVSSTSGSAEASLRAVKAARDFLVDGVDGATVEVDVADALVAAAAVAQVEASDATPEKGAPPHAKEGPPSSTFVAVVAQTLAEGYRLSAGWLGDSRAYWIDTEPQQITTDHEVQGSLSRWLGSDSADVTPEINQLTVPGPGRLVVCSDGLWRYANSPGEMQTAIDRLISESPEPEQHSTDLALAVGLVEFANSQGGHDNISVALWSPRTDSKGAEV